MKRRFFLAGLIAAPVAVAAAPALAEQPVHRGLPTGSGFTAEELQSVSDCVVARYRLNKRVFGLSDGADET